MKFLSGRVVPVSRADMASGGKLGVRARGTRRLVWIPCVVLALVAAGCTGSDTSEGPVVEAKSESRLPPPETDVDSVTWALPQGEPGSLDPPKTYDTSPNQVLANMCENLMRQNPDLSVSPGLAESVSRPSDTKYVFKIRQGVQFWNGQPLTAEDVAYSLSRNLSSLGNTSNYSHVYANVKSVRSTGAHEVTVEMIKPDDTFMQYAVTAATAVSEKAYVERAGSDYGTSSGGLMCTGPFVFKSWTPGNSIVIERNPEYWDEEYQAHAETFTFKFISDSSTLVQALRVGEIDGTVGAPTSVLSALKSAENVEAYNSTVSLNFVQLIPASTKGPISDVLIRRALNIAIDRQAIVDGIINGAAEPITWMMPHAAMQPPAVSPEEASVYESALETLPDSPDLETAKDLVEQAGSPKQPIVLAIPQGDDTTRRIASILQQNAKSIGLQMELKPVTDATLLNMYYDADVRKGVDLLWDVEAYMSPSPIGFVPLWVGPSASVNLIEYESSELDAHLAAAMNSGDPVEQAENMAPVLVEMAENAVTIPLYARNATVVLNDRLTGAALSTPYPSSSPWAALIGGK
jgi:peptide/nickel transport system substrate-binding protein